MQELSAQEGHGYLQGELWGEGNHLLWCSPGSVTWDTERSYKLAELKGDSCAQEQLLYTSGGIGRTEKLEGIYKQCMVAAGCELTVGALFTALETVSVWLNAMQVHLQEGWLNLGHPIADQAADSLFLHQEKRPAPDGDFRAAQ